MTVTFTLAPDLVIGALALIFGIGLAGWWLR